MPAAPKGLHDLALLHGVQTAYRDNDGQRVTASPESLMAALRALRVPLREAGDAPRLVARGRRERWERALEPLVVAWDDRPSSFGVRLRGTRPARLEVVVVLEDAGERAWSAETESLEAMESATVDGMAWTRVSVPLPALPHGYHDLHVTVNAAGRPPEAHTALLVSAPARAAGWEALGEGRHWGVFAPLYALYAEGGGAPTFDLLDRLAGEVARHGGTVVGTLPLLASFLDHPYEPSPYAPVSRLFWNEVYVRPDAGAGAAVATRPRGSGSGRPAPFDGRSAMAVKRPPLERRAVELFGGGSGWPAEMEAFRARNPRVEDYARFRALTEARGPWPRWPDRLRARDVRPGDYPEEAARYHVYVQWAAERELAQAKESAEDRGVGLYLDLPLGVHPDGYDVWRERAIFATGAAAGAPPDPLATGGQNWGFPPLHPEESRQQRHAYFIASIRKHLRFARVLRIDHVMQLHRMFWVPSGVDSAHGVYVRYPAEELYAILCLESRRAGAVIVGEDLGTVPREVRRAMRRHGFPGMWVGEFELTEGAGGTLLPRPVPPGALASIDTHDTPTFAGWWWGRDAEMRRELGLMSSERAEAELEGRAELRRKLAHWAGVSGTGARPVTDERAEGAGAPEAATPAPSHPAGSRNVEEARRVHGEWLRWMGSSRAGLVLATLEDLWLEMEPQNVPGTTTDRNWRRRARRPLGALRDPAVAEQLRALDESREGNG